MAVLILGLVLFLGMHSITIVAPAWREHAVARLGLVGWQAVYSAVSLLGFALLIWGYGLARAQPVPVYVPPLWTSHLVLLLMLPVFPLLLATYLPGRIKTAVQHPMLAAVKLWAFAHLLANGQVHDLVLFGAFLAWAVASGISVKHRGPLPVPGAPPGKVNDLVAVIGGLLLYGAFIGGVHAWLIGVSPLVRI